MSDTFNFILDGNEVEAQPGETIWEIARRNRIAIPHLCHPPQPGGCQSDRRFYPDRCSHKSRQFRRRTD